MRAQSSASPRPPSPTASACWRVISAPRCSNAAIAASTSTAAAGPVSRRCSASSPRSRRLRATALRPPAGAHRLGRGGGREVAAAQARLVQGGPSRHRHRARDQPPRRRPVAARLRRLARLFGRALRAAPAEPARGHAARGDPLQGAAAAGVQPGAARRARPPPRPGRAARLAAALRSRLGRRLVVLVRPPGRAHPGPLAGLGLPPLLDAGPGGRERTRGRDRTPDADRPRAGEKDPGAALRPPGGGARALLPHHHRRLAAAARAAGVPGMDPARGAGRDAAAWSCSASAIARDSCRCSDCCCVRAADSSTTASLRI